MVVSMPEKGNTQPKWRPVCMPEESNTGVISKGPRT